VKTHILDVLTIKSEQFFGISQPLSPKSIVNMNKTFACNNLKVLHIKDHAMKILIRSGFAI
jgi:hypothetical protein